MDLQQVPDIPLLGSHFFCEFLNSICRSKNIQSVVDIGCGDLTWMVTTEVFATRTYTRIDVVPTLVDSHQKKYPHHRFYHLNPAIEEVPKADLVIIRDVFCHLSLAEIQRMLQNVRGKYKYYLFASSNNELNLFKAPFFLQSPLQEVVEPTFGRQACLFDDRGFSLKKYIVYNKFISNYITMEHFTFCKELEQYDWTCVSQEDTTQVKTILAEESVVLLVTYDHLNIQSYQVNPKCKIIYKLDDQHVIRPNAANLLKCAWQVVSPYAYLLPHPNKLWIPYSFMDAYSKSVAFNKTPINKIFVSGAIASCYPFRSYVSALNDERLIKLSHPGYHVPSNSVAVGLQFIQKLNEYLCCFTDASAFKYILLKNFEICGAGSLLLTDKAIKSELKLLGFQDMVNCVMCDKDTFLDKVTFILDTANRSRIDEIRLNGMNLVKERHLTSHRANEFHNQIQELIQKV